jgi:hypothetical protein
MISIATLESEEVSIAHYTLYVGYKANSIRLNFLRRHE